MAGERNFAVTIASPASGASFGRGQRVSLPGDAGIVGEAIPPSRQPWTAEGVNPADEANAQGTGSLVTTGTLLVGTRPVTRTATAKAAPALVG